MSSKKKTEWEFKSPKSYEFTINFNDQHQYPNTDLRLTKCKKLLEDIMRVNTWKYNLRPELSMPQVGDNHSGTMSRVHYHGIIHFNDDKEIYTFLLTLHYRLTRIGRVQWNPLRWDHWTKYIRKQKSIIPGHYKIANIQLEDMKDL